MLKDKSEMPEVVKQFVADTALIRREYHLLCLRRDNAGENNSQELEAWLRDKGIRLEKFTPHELWQNGKAKNHIKVLCNIARTNRVASGFNLIQISHGLLEDCVATSDLSQEAAYA